VLTDLILKHLEVFYMYLTITGCSYVDFVWELEELVS